MDPGEPYLSPAGCVLAIDLGSGSVKSAVVSENGDVISCAAEPIDTFFLPGGGAEQDPEQWWGAAKRTASNALAQSGISSSQVAAVACDSQWSVVVPVDEQAHPLANAVHWLDTRGGPHNRALAGGFPAIDGYNLFKLRKWIGLTGLVPTHSGVDSLGHVLYLKHEQPDLYCRTHKFLEPMDYLTSRLTGKISATQKTMSPFMVSENRTWGQTRYSDVLLKMAGLERDKFPEMIENNGIAGTLAPGPAAELGLSSSVKVIAGIGDSNVSAIGSGAIDDYEAVIYIGTSMYMTFHVPFKKTDILRMMTVLPSPFPGRYYLLGEQGAGGRCLQFFLHQLIYPKDGFGSGELPDDAYERFNAMAASSTPGSNGVIFLPWLNGSIIPNEDAHMRGGFINLSFNTNRGDMARAVMEGLAFNNRWTRESAEAFAGRKIPHFRFSGGGAQSDLWAQIHADVLGVPIHQVEDPVNATVRGCALLAQVCLGQRSLARTASMIRIRRVFEPDPANAPVYDKMYRQYRQLFKRNRKIFHALNGPPN